MAIALCPRKCHPSSKSVFDVLSPSPSLDKLCHACGHGQHHNTGCCCLGVHAWRCTPRRPHLLSTSDCLLVNAYLRLWMAIWRAQHQSHVVEIVSYRAEWRSYSTSGSTLREGTCHVCIEQTENKPICCGVSIWTALQKNRGLEMVMVHDMTPTHERKTYLQQGSKTNVTPLSAMKRAV